MTPELPPQAASAVLAAARSILSANGEVPLLPIEARTLASLHRHLLGGAGAVPEAGWIDPQLGELVRDPAARELVAGVVTVLPLIDGQLNPEKLELARRVAASLGYEHDAFKSMRALAEGKVLRARYCLLRRAVRDVYHRSLLEAVGLVIHANVVGDPALVKRYRALRTLPEDSFGGQLYRFYQDNLYQFPGERGAFPPAVTAAHDARHVVAGWDASFEGEFGLVCFEAGLARSKHFDWAIAVIVHGNLGIEMMEGDVPTRRDVFDPEVYYRELARGMAADAAILEPDWGFWPLLPRPLAEVRARLGVGPGGSTALGQPWHGGHPPAREELPLDKVTLLPHTAGTLLALRVEGSLTREDIGAVDGLLARMTWSKDPIDLYLELGDAAEWADGRSLLAELALLAKRGGSLRRIAVVGGSAWQQLLVTLDRPFARLFGVSERFFGRDEAAAALAFVRGEARG
ncbi:MAG: STAS/SEC14 domain-containing protein [Myxococcales bacterium]|nr:STAS/SEC14 domain-containing protein [Myxococcales bacterium]